MAEYPKFHVPWCPSDCGHVGQTFDPLAPLDPPEPYREDDTSQIREAGKVPPPPITQPAIETVHLSDYGHPTAADRRLADHMRQCSGCATCGPAQPNICHCVGVTVAPMPAPHAKYEPGCVFGEIRREVQRQVRQCEDCDPGGYRCSLHYPVTNLGNCRCGQVRQGASQTVVPHKPGDDARCRWYGKLSDLSALVEWTTGTDPNTDWPLSVSNEMAEERADYDWPRTREDVDQMMSGAQVPVDPSAYALVVETSALCEAIRQVTTAEEYLAVDRTFENEVRLK